jgi:hypothetical protein
MHRSIGVKPCRGEAVQGGLVGDADGTVGQEFLHEQAVLHALGRRAKGGNELGVTEGGLPHALSFGTGGGHTGLAKDVLATGEGEVGGVMMQPGGRADPDDIDFVIVHDILPTS